MYWSGVSTIIKDGERLQGRAGLDYTIEKLLNDGASIVYKAKRDDGKDIFLKQFKDPLENSKDWKDFIDFQHSILNTLMQLPSNIVEINYEYFEYKGVHFHAKAFEDGKDLAKVIWDDKPDIKKRLNIALISLGILNSVHKKGVVHSDLKPQQFFVIPDSSVGMGFRVKLIDFDHCMIPSLNLSRPAGTAEWRSPEHINDNNIGFHSDVFTMGQIIYALITGGKQPYKHSIDNDTYDNDIMFKIGYISIDTLFKGKLPQELSDIVDKMLDPIPTARPTIKEVHEVFLKVLNTKPKPAKAEHITLESNGKSRLIVQTQTITREIVKSSFGNHNEIYNKQFEILKDDSGDWFVKGYDVPPTAKDAKGNVYNFHKTLYNGANVTNKYIKIEDGGIINVGDVNFKVRID
ncbi:MAG: protein kinase [Campylobacterota bacterium]|nr:protein kinase [Campylobacterota bacterium]